MEVHEEGAVSTEEGGEVEQHAVTSPPESVSAPKVSNDADKRIRDLMSRGDKLQNELQTAKTELSKSLVERSNLQKQFEELKKQFQELLDGTNKTTQEYLEKHKTLGEENANLKAELKKARLLAENPDLVPFASLIPTTEDDAKLTEALNTIRAARENDQKHYREHVRSGVIPPANPARPNLSQMDPAAIDRYLKSARNTEEFEARLKEVAEKAVAS